jgi:hypothetical protein
LSDARGPAELLIDRGADRLAQGNDRIARSFQDRATIAAIKKSQPAALRITEDFVQSPPPRHRDCFAALAMTA